MTWYPEAERVPWLYPSPDGRPTYYKGLCVPKAVVLHVAEGYQRTARQWALEGYYRASRHFSVAIDGSIMQHLDFQDGGYHAGISAEHAKQHPPTWELWEGPNQNVNLYTIGIEHEGFYQSVLSDPRQKAASKALCQWLSEELGIPLDEAHFPPHAAIDTVNRANDFSTPERRAQWYAELTEDQMSSKEYDALVEAVFGTQGRMDELKANGIGSLETRVSNFESNDGPIGKRLAALESGTTTGSATSFTITGGTLEVQS